MALPSVTLALIAATRISFSQQPCNNPEQSAGSGLENKGDQKLSVALDCLLCHFCLGTQHPFSQPLARPALPTLELSYTPLSLADI